MSSFDVASRTGDSSSNCSPSIQNDDDEYEEAIVYVKFEDFADVNFFLESKEIEIKNVEGTTPQCDVDGFRFAGTHSINLGSLLFFKKKTLPLDLSEMDLAGSTSTTLEFSLRSIPTVQNVSG